MSKEYEVFWGRLDRNPELRCTKDGGYLCDFSIEINSGKNQLPIWKKVVTWGELAQQCSQSLRKGHEVLVRGKTSIKSFQTMEGESRTYEEVAAHFVVFANT